MDDIEHDESVHLRSDCDEDNAPDPSKEPRPPDYSDSDEDGTEMEFASPAVSPVNLLLKGKTIVPQYGSPVHLYQANELAGAGSSSVSLPTGHMHLLPSSQHQDLVWAGSSLGTMHQVPVDKCVFHINDLQRTGSVLSKSTKMSSCRFSSLTVSDSGTDMFAFCRICQMGGDEKDPLFSPCRCSGSLRYIHSSCLKKWIRISQRRGKKHPPRCEICHYQFNRHKRFKFSQWRWPRVRRRDKCLHIIFLLNLLIMIGCAIATVMCFLSDRGSVAKFPQNKVKLTSEEVITLTCGVTFFVAFFIAMTVEIKARHTLYKLFLRFVTHNTEWTVDQYDIGKDPLFKHARPSNV